MIRGQGKGVVYLGFLLRINVVNAVNGLYFFAVPYPVSEGPNGINIRMQKTGPRLHGSHRFRSCSWKKLSRSNESLANPDMCSAPLSLEEENRDGIHTCGVQKPSVRG